MKLTDSLRAQRRFSSRHIGPDLAQCRTMLQTMGLDSLEALIDAAVPRGIRMNGELDLPQAATESEALAELRQVAGQNAGKKSFLGMGYHGCSVPPVIQRNILENPGWYTQYTPYQAEISQGRLEALLNFQTMVSDLTGMDTANASLLDEGTAAAEAMAMCFALKTQRDANQFFVDEGCHPQTLSVIQTRANPLGIEIVVGDAKNASWDAGVFGVLVQNPSTRGEIQDLTPLLDGLASKKILRVVAIDILSLVLFKSPGEMGADIVVGSTQRFGVPMGFGGPHAAFLATRNEFQRAIPGRIVGVSKDSHGDPAIRLALQTREQHIRRDKATSNICTAQVLLAVMASMYAVYHGPQGLREIALRVHALTTLLAAGLKKLGYSLSGPFFDSICVATPHAQAIGQKSETLGMNVRVEPDWVGVSLDETTSPEDVERLWQAFAQGKEPAPAVAALEAGLESGVPASLWRDPKAVLTHPVFSQYRSETEMQRYIRSLEARDLSLTRSMIPLGSCTMKLNAAAELFPISWPEFAGMHPFAPENQTAGYRKLFTDLEKWLCEVTGFAATSLQPNSGAQGEYAGLLAIRAYHQAQGQSHRDICLIPVSAHGTNPASAVMAGMKVVGVRCDSEGNIDLEDLRTKAQKTSENLAALMVTYPSTHGVFETEIREICEIVHKQGGQVYLDGANMNAQVGLCKPADYGADVCHLNLHKTFCIPHGGGGPGVGPICVQSHLAPHLPSHPLKPGSVGPVSAAPWGSASILPISWMYLRMMGAAGLKQATEVAILNANYIAHRLEPHYPVLFKGAQGRVAHECIIDLRPLKKTAGIEVDDVAKRLMDYGFHAPTMSWPVPGTMMIEPTESEELAELDRFCEAMISIRKEIALIEQGKWDKQDNPLKNAPHTAAHIASEAWDHSYDRATAAFPAKWVTKNKFWPVVGRIDNVWGDRNLFCSCPPVELSV